ncbi:MAG: hypothetical protein KDK76_01145 [Chlamydiia bacterium]|nr:hypothetical protein [Chlamydiia bacterium]
MNMLKASRIIILMLFPAILFLSGCERPKGFTVKKITSHHAPMPEWEIPSPFSRGELDALFNQPFRYLGSGNHTYAFVSEDDRLVIKFFKQKHMKTRTWADFLPIPAKKIFYPMGKIHRRMQERREAFTSYKIAYEELKEETAILYLHLNKTDHLGITLTLIDQNGNSLKVPLDQMEFLVQKRATLAFNHLKNLYQEGKNQEAIEAITSLLNVVAKRSQKGIYDKDLQLFKNFGFIENQAVEIDIGEFRKDETPNPMHDELKALSLQIHDFVKLYAPKHLKEVDLSMKQEIKRYEPNL